MFYSDTIVKIHHGLKGMMNESQYHVCFPFSVDNNKAFPVHRVNEAVDKWRENTSPNPQCGCSSVAVVGLG